MDIRHLTEEQRRAAESLGVLDKYEKFWRDHYEWLRSSGYVLRPRYHPEWEPSWNKTHRNPIFCEDSAAPVYPQIMDAVRIEDDTQVILKKLSKSTHPYEIEIGQLFSSESLASDPQNHCIPILGVHHLPDDDDLAIIVMPLTRQYDDPEFDSFGEVIDFFRQVFEGIQFMHKHHVAHRDCNAGNIMMDGHAICPEGFDHLRPHMDREVKSPSTIIPRTRSRPKYYLIDFGISRTFDPEDGLPLEEIIMGGDRTVPEFKEPFDPQNPFPTDVYYIGNMIRTEFLDGDPLLPEVNGRYGFEFMRPLVNDMIQDDPTKRPTMDEVVHRYEEIVKGLGWWKLRSRVVPRTDNWAQKLHKGFRHWKLSVGYIFTRVPAIPKPPSVPEGGTK